MTARILLAILAAAFLSGMAEPIGRLVADVLQGGALLGIIFIAFWLMLATPFRHRL